MTILLSGSDDICLDIAKKIGLENIDHISRFSINFESDSVVSVTVSFYPSEEHIKSLSDFIDEQKLYLARPDTN